MSADADKSPNPKIDSALKKLMGKLDDENEALETKLKLINTAINWEKVKHQIKDDDEFDPSAI